MCFSDCYMHNPRGSNNRLNEKSANRDNANRLFDSQNNNRGGYNAGDTDETNGFQSEDQIYYMQYFQSSDRADSKLTIEWTNQHGCGGNEDDDPNKLNCNIVIQYMVSDVCDAGTDKDCLRNGVNTGTQTHTPPASLTETPAQFANRKNAVDQSQGLHETFDYYDDCYMRTRNTNLFTADQNLRNNNLGISSARHTRQNPNGNRRGYECPEERDYYPYWHPTQWRDIAILADNASQCDWYLDESFNVQPRGICKEYYPGTTQVRSWSIHNNQADCENAGGQWFTEYAYIDIETGISESECESRDPRDELPRKWASPKFDEPEACLVLPSAPTCEPAGWTRSNHLGNGRDGVPLNYTWTIPYFPSGSEKMIIVRIRYNISTDDYDPFNTDSSQNQNLGALIRSPVEQNPYINIGATTNKALRLAINTAQFGRTFQDRSHVIRLLPRSEISHEDAETCTIYNLNVRGKRGNIVQVYPSVEYDFIPNRLDITESDCLYIQWTGSNTHNNGAPGGDGQTGDAGEGTPGTDRHSMVEIPDANSNYPLPWERTSMWRDVELVWRNDEKWTVNANQELSDVDVAVAFASGGYYGCYEDTTCDRSLESLTPRVDKLLNNVSPSFDGAVLKFRAGTYHYISSRNNNFTNRSQKGRLRVRSS